LSWSTDIHLNFLSGAEIGAFAQRVLGDEPDAIVVTGDIAEAPSLERHIVGLYRALGRPLYFVLGNHDFYHGDIEESRQVARTITANIPDVTWLPTAGVCPLTERTALVGVDGWGDGRLGDPAGTPVNLNDFRLIEDLLAPSRAQLVSRVRALGDAEAASLSGVLERACASHESIIVATHVPPFREACWHDGKVSNDEWLPWFTCAAVGEVLRAAAEAHPSHDFTVLCGHTHSGGVAQIVENLVVRTGGADYGAPGVADVIDVA